MLLGPGNIIKNKGLPARLFEILSDIYPQLGRPLLIYLALFSVAGLVAEIVWLIVFRADESSVYTSA